MSDSASSAFGAATSSAANQYARASDSAELKADDAFNAATSTWSESRLKAYLDARGVPVPQSGKKDEILAAVRLNKHKAATGWSAWTFDTWTLENLKDYLSSSGDAAAKKAANKAGATREQLLSAAQDSYNTASKSSGDSYASVTSYLAKQTDAAKDSVFDTWSESGKYPPPPWYDPRLTSTRRAQELPRLLWIQGPSRIYQESTRRIRTKLPKLLSIRHNHTSRNFICQAQQWCPMGLEPTQPWCRSWSKRSRISRPEGS